MEGDDVRKNASRRDVPKSRSRREGKTHNVSSSDGRRAVVARDVGGDVL